MRRAKGMSETVPTERLWLKCRNCRKKWYPDARKWKDKSLTEERIIQCPFCHVKNVIPKLVVQHLLKAVRKTEWGIESLASQTESEREIRDTKKERRYNV